MSTVPEQADNPTYNTPPKLAVVMSIILALAFIAAVILGARILTDRATYKPAAVSPVIAPAAESPECRSIKESLPDKLDHFKKVEIVEPIPAGTAAYRDGQGTELTIRCGVDTPDQYTVLSKTHEAGGSDWLTVTDATPESNLRTYYQVGGSPVLAVTTEAEIGNALPEISHAATGNIDPQQAPEPQPFPLAQTSLEGDGHAQMCREFIGSLPDSIGDYRAQDVSHVEGSPSQSKAWLAEDKEPVVVRCGVALPESYEAGATLNQVDDVPWFAEPGLAEGSTSGRWYALGREAVVALYMPGAQGNDVISAITGTIMDTLPEENN